MKYWNNRKKTITAVLLAVLFFIPCGAAAFFYTKPMEAVSYNLSIIPEDGQEWEGNKGWTVFTAEGNKRKELSPNGTGGYEGMEKSGQTFYFSRTLSENLDNPTLQLGTANRTVSVFLDDVLIYTDCPKEDNRIGYLTLPMLEYDRTEPVTVSLPIDYQGRILTIAQATPKAEAAEKMHDPFTVYPCDTILYCGYSYESSLIASASKTMVPATLLFAVILLLLALLIWNASQGKLCLSLLVFAAAVFFWMCSILVKADFFYAYTTETSVDLVSLCFDLSIASMLAFFAVYGKGVRIFLIPVCGVQILATALSVLVQKGQLVPYGETYLFLQNSPQITGFFSLLSVLLVSGIREGRKVFSAFTGLAAGRNSQTEKTFFSHFCFAALVISVGYGGVLIAGQVMFPDYVEDVRLGLAGDFSSRLPNRSLRMLFFLCFSAGLYAALIHLLTMETERRTRILVLEEKNRMTLESYENLKRQSEEMQMMRHDTMKHYLFLQRAVKEAPEKISGYLDSLIGEWKNIRPVAVSGNKLIDMILNGKLNQASQKGISVRFHRMEAPENLPLSDKDACSLFMNILDNAIEGAGTSLAEKPYLYLDLHCKENHFIFSCENSAAAQEGREEGAPIPGHGYGLKIVSHIMEPYGNMVNIKRYKTAFSISVVIPL